jgi:hypothetical protein
MKTYTNKLLLVVLVAPLLSSCFSYKNLTKKEPITYDLLSKLKPGKKYKFELAIRQTQKIYISEVTGDRITGYLYNEGKYKTNRHIQSVNTISGQIEYQKDYVKETRSNYSDNFENITKNVTRISRRKFDPLKTTALIVLPTAAIIGVMFIPYSIPIVLTP